MQRSAASSRLMSSLGFFIAATVFSSFRVASAVFTECSAAAPPTWPVRFKILQRKIPEADPECNLGTCSNITMYYDWERQANLILDSPDKPGAEGTLWDLELGSHCSYYFHPTLRECKFHLFDVGILRRDWLAGAQFTGVSTINGQRVLGWTKADFIDYYADAQDCTPVRWYFHAMRAAFDTVKYLEAEAVPDESLFEPPSYCPNRTGNTVASPPRPHINSVPRQHESSPAIDLKMRLCSDNGCSTDCKQYIVPLARCYNPAVLFHNDSQWGAYDIVDRVNTTHLNRSFFASVGGTCDQRTDGFVVPLNRCIGPFGAPRPWGTFELDHASVSMFLL